MKTRTVVACAAVVAANAAIMSVEMLATRLLFPQFGNTVFTWSAIISIIIAGLFFGYMIGGWAAQRAKDKDFLVFCELLAAGLLTMFVPGLRDVLLATQKPGIYPPLLGCFAVFGVPAAFLASVPPAGVGILTDEGVGPSLASGIVSALSAFASIAGTLLTTFYLIPEFGVRELFLASGAALGVMAAVVKLSGKKPRSMKAAVVLVLYAAALPLAASANSHPVRLTVVEPIYSKDSHYQFIRVFEQGEGPTLMRVLMLDSTHEGAMAIDSKEAIFEYTRAYRLFANAIPRDIASRILFIGGGAYTMPIKVAQGLPNAKVEVAEIDPVVRDVAAKYFESGSVPNLTTILSDGRQALRGAAGVYDGMFIDAYQGVMAIPFHLTTREFFGEVSAGLKPEGFVSLNVIGDVLEKDGFFCSTLNTLSSVFPSVRVYPVSGLVQGAQNLIIVASKRQGGLPGGDSVLAGTGFDKGIDHAQLPCVGGKVLTDDYAPVEWLVARYLK